MPQTSRTSHSRNGNQGVPSRRNANTRYDLQGMRGIGVIGVVLGHLYLRPEGVFALLDVFFVLSGFVITMVLLDIDEKYGRVLFFPFYLARARRLLPMGLFVTAVTIALSYVVFNRQKADLIAEDGFFSTIFWANWHFAGQEDYFASQHQSPFLHYWSLSVEEQFYAVWPLFLLAALFAFRRLRRRRYALASVMAIVAVGFFLYSLWHSAVSPTVAYFSTFDRAWEFAAGGVLAALRPELAKIPGAVAKPMGWIGLNTLWIPIFLLSPSDPFPAPWGLLPVASTLTVIAAGVGRDTRYLWMVDNRALRYVGDISYSVYLWHLPAIVLLAPFFDSSLQYQAAVIASTAVLSVVFFHLVEKPARFATWLMTPPERKKARRRKRRSSRPMQFGWLAVLATVTLLGSLVAVQRGGTDLDTVAGLGPQDQPTGPQTVEEVEAGLEESLRLALASESFPSYFDDLRFGTDVWREQLEGYACDSSRVETMESCTFGSDNPEAPTIAVVGDSTASAWMPAVVTWAPAGWRVVQLTNGWCGGWTLPSYRISSGEEYPLCEQRQRERDDVLSALRPDIIMVASASDHVRNAERDDLGGDYTPEQIAETGLRSTLERYSEWTSDLVVVAPRPRSPSPIDCVSRVGSPESCVGSTAGNWAAQFAGERAAAEGAGARYIDTSAWFCVDGRCPAWAGEVAVTADGSHLTVPYSRNVVGPLLADRLFAQDAGTPPPRRPD